MCAMCILSSVLRCSLFSRLDYLIYNILTEHHDGLVHERCNCSALAMDLLLSCTYPSIYKIKQKYFLRMISHNEFNVDFGTNSYFATILDTILQHICCTTSWSVSLMSARHQATVPVSSTLEIIRYVGSMKERRPLTLIFASRVILSPLGSMSTSIFLARIVSLFVRWQCMGHLQRHLHEVRCSWNDRVGGLLLWRYNS